MVAFLNCLYNFLIVVVTYKALVVIVTLEALRYLDQRRKVKREHNNVGGHHDSEQDADNAHSLFVPQILLLLYSLNHILE